MFGDELINFEHGRPFNLIGTFREKDKVLVRVFIPEATDVSIEVSGSRKLSYEKGNQVFEALFDDIPETEHYRVYYTGKDKREHSEIYPYSFKPEISPDDIYLFKEGQLKYAYRTFGAHVENRDGISGVRFIVWAPNAKAVSVVGDFNSWDYRRYPMENVNDSGIWEIFIPDLKHNAFYKYAIKFQNGQVEMKSDPFSFYMEKRPRTASIVTDLNYDWTDSGWIQTRNNHQSKKSPISIYEIHLGSWKRPWDNRDFMNIRDFGNDLINYVKDLGFTHIEMMPIMEHPLDESWGYQVVNYYAPTSRYGTPEDYMWFINECHKNNIGVILDWVPAHFPEDEYGLYNFDGTHLYDHADPRLGKHPDWGTRIFNLARYEVRNYVLSNAVYWIDVFHADGIRIDAVSSMLYLDYSRKEGEWIPNIYGGRENLDSISFFRELNSFLHSTYPYVITIAEESTAWPGVTNSLEAGGLGFDFKWNMGWMHDTLEYFSLDPVYRKYHQNLITFTIWYAFSESFILPLSHDEVVHMKGSLFTKMPGDEWQKMANLRCLYAFMFLSPGKKLVFMGSEWGQHEEWNVKEGLRWEQASYFYNARLIRFFRDALTIYTNNNLSVSDQDPSGFEWIDFSDYNQSVFSFIRKTGNEGFMLAVFNLTPVPRLNYRIGVPRQGFYKEILNSDSEIYGGSNMGNFGGVNSDPVRSHGKNNSINLTLPPLSCVVFRFNSDEDER